MLPPLYVYCGIQDDNDSYNTSRDSIVQLHFQLPINFDVNGFLSITSVKKFHNKTGRT